LIVSWPDGLDPDLAGGLTSELGHAIDIMPTFLDVAGVASIQQQPMPLEGKSILAAITGEPSLAVERGPLFWAHNKGWAVREGDWKLVSKDKKTWELYNLTKDGTELNDVVARYPDKVAKMTKLFEEWDARTNLGVKKATGKKK